MIKKICFFLCCALTMSVCGGCAGGQQLGSNNSNDGGLDLPQLSDPTEGEDIAVMETDMGTIKLRFFPQYAPKAVENFITHSRNGYYDGVTFHRIIKDFMIQGGDPLGTGMGGESIWGDTFAYEVTPSLRHFRGALAMAHSSLPDSNGSQFYIVQNDDIGNEMKTYFTELLSKQDEDISNELMSYCNGFVSDQNNAKIKVKQFFPANLLNKYINDGGAWGLDGDYTVFGHVIEGMDVVDKIAGVKTSGGNEGKPFEDVIINSISIEQYKK